MPLRGTPLFPTLVAGVGTNNRAFKSVQPANDSTTKATFGTTTTVGYKQFWPGVNNANAVVATPPAAGTNFGWNLIASDMDETGARRLLPSGNYTMNCVFGGATADTTTNFGVHVRFYKRFADGTLSALIASGETVGLSIGATAANVDVIVNVTSNQIFEVGQTLQMEVWAKGRGGGATGALSQILTFYLGTNLNNQIVQLDIPQQGLVSLFARTGAVIMTGVTATPAKRVRLAAKTATMTGVSGFNRAIMAFRKPAAIMAGTPGFGRSIIAVRSFAATMVGVAAPRGIRVRLERGVTMVGVPAASKKIFIVRAVQMVGVAARSLLVRKPFAVVTTPAAGFGRAVIAVRSFAATMLGRPDGRVEMPFSALNRITGGGSGGTTIVKKIINIFDD